jgi:hypothetical protein
MVKVTGCVLAVLGLCVIADGAASANDTKVYKLVVNGKPVKLGTVVNGELHGCDGFSMQIPPDSKLEPAGSACPSEDELFAPQSGHYPKETPTPKPRHT